MKDETCVSVNLDVKLKVSDSTDKSCGLLSCEMYVLPQLFLT